MTDILKNRIIGAILAAAMLLGLAPNVAVSADDEPILLRTQKTEVAEYDENAAYVMMGTVQSETDERGRYVITVYRCGNTSAESTVDLKTIDVSAKYGEDYIIDDDRYITETIETDKTLLALSADEENVREGEEKLESLREMVNSMADTEENADKPEATLDMFYMSNDEETENNSDLPSEQSKSSLAKLKEEQTGLPTRPTYETDMEPVTNVIMNSLGVADIAEYIEASSVTSLVFAPGETEKRIIIKILEDGEPEGQEIINFMLSNPDENTLLAEPTITSVIINDDEPVVHSKVSFSSDEFSANDGSVEITVTRNEALYSYVTAKVRTVENGSAREGKNYSFTDTEIEFRPYQDEVSFEIPVSADKDMSFDVELYDPKGREDGAYMSARVNIDAAEDDNANIFLLSSSEEIEINGKTYRLEREGNVAKIMDDDKVNPTHVGNYYYPTTDNVTYGFSRGDTERKHNEYNAGGGYGYLECDNWHVDYHGEEYAKFFFPAKRYQAAWLDFSSHSDWGNSWHGFRLVPNYSSSMITSSDEVNSQIDEDFHRSYKNGRGVYGPIILLTDRELFMKKSELPPASWNNNLMEIYARRNGNGWIAPETHFYGIVLMFREFHVSVEQPNEMEFRTPNGTVKERPARVVNGEGQKTVYMDQTLTINSTATENGGVIKGTLKGYQITAGKGEKSFFYKTNSTSIKFDEDFVSLIDKNTNEIVKKNDGYNTTLWIKPVYDYIPVKMEVLPTDDGKFTDSALQESSDDTLHVGDTLSVNAEPLVDGYTYDTYSLESYRMKEMAYFSLDPEVAQVSEDGVVTAVGGGQTTVYAFDMISGISDEIEITVDDANKPSGGTVSEGYIVIFETNGGSKVTSRSVLKNSTIKEPTAPTKDGFEFAGWYTDREFTSKYDFSDKVTGSVTLYAKWIENEPQTDASQRKNPFEDVKETDWFYDAVTEAASRGIVKGVSDTEYDPNGILTRAMLVTVLHRYAGEPIVNYAMPYTDIADDAWYTEAVRWAASEQIVMGLDDTTFAPNAPITREQAAAILYRYARCKGEGFTGSWMFPLDYADSADVSEYAYEALCWSTANGIINGMGDRLLSPKTYAARAQIAAIMVRLDTVLRS